MYCRRPTTDRAGATRFLIVQTGSTFAELRARRGDFPDWFRIGLGLASDAVDVVRADAGEPLPTRDTHAGVIVTGSPAMVSERARWSEQTAAWLRDRIAAGTPVLGVCYGHQLLAHALGGHVDYHPSGREIGTVAIERLPQSIHDALLATAPEQFQAHASHQQSVLELPRGAVTLARSAHDPHHAVRYAPNAWGLQFHRSSASRSCAATCIAARAPVTAIARRPAARGASICRRPTRVDCCVGFALSRWRVSSRTCDAHPRSWRAETDASIKPLCADAGRYGGLPPADRRVSGRRGSC